MINDKQPARQFDNDFPNRRDVLGGGARAAAALSFSLSPVSAIAQILQPKRGGELKVAVYSAPSNLDAIAGTSGSDAIILDTYMETLCRFDEDTFKAVPGLAKSWEYTQPNVLELRLQEGVRFHDGTLFDADAVKFNLERGKTDPRSRIARDLSAITAVAVVDRYTVSLRLAGPDVSVPMVLADRAGYMGSPTAIKERGDQYERSPVGTGRWKFVRYTTNQSVVVERNENYWQPNQPHLDRISMHIITDGNTALRSVISGENQLSLRVSPQQEDMAAGSPGLVVGNLSSGAFYLTLMNYGVPPLNDRRVREALSYAINRDAMNAVMNRGKGAPAWGHFGHTHWAYDRSLENIFPHNIERAKKLLADAGHPNGLDLEIIAWTDPESQRRVELMIEMLKPVGVRLKPTMRTLAEATQMFAVEKKGHLYNGLWIGRLDPSLSLKFIFEKQSFLNPEKADPPPGFDAALLASTTSVDVEARRRALMQLQRIIVENALSVPLYYDRFIWAHHRSVKGFRMNAVGRPRFDNVFIDRA